MINILLRTLCVLTFLLGELKGFALEQQEASVTLNIGRGQVGRSGEIQVKVTLFENYYPALHDWNVLERMASLAGDDIVFGLTLPDAKLYKVHIDFMLENRPANIFGEPIVLPIESGDAYRLIYKDDGLRAAGPGSEKINCLLKLYKKTTISLSEQIINLANRKQFMAYAFAVNDLIDSVQSEAVSLLNAFGSNISDQGRAYLLDFLKGRLESAKLSMFKSFRAKKEYPLNEQEVDALFNHLFEPYALQEPEKSVLALQHLRAHYEMEREWLRAKRYLVEGINKVNYDTLFLTIKTKYHGTVRDALLLYMMATDVSMLTDMQGKFAASYKAMEDDGFKKGISLLENRLGKLAKVLPFKFYDINGNEYTNTFFKDKLVVFDFWYTGCGACANLFRTSKPIREYFKDNEGIMFVSVNVDFQQEKWEKGLQSGLYTDNCELNLWVKEKGFTNSFLKSYGFNGYPRILVMDGDGNLVSANLPHLDTDQDVARFIALINNAN